MADTFATYNNLSSALDAGTAAKDAALQKLAENKEKGDLIGKTLGEVKGFFTGQSAMKKIVKNIVKPKVEKELKPYLKKKLQNLRDAYNKESIPENIPESDTRLGRLRTRTAGESESNPINMEPIGEVEDEPPSTGDLDSMVENTESRFNRLFGGDGEGTDFSDADANGLMRQGQMRVARYEARVSTGEADSDERLLSNGARVSRKTTFSDKDQGFDDFDDSGSVYDRANGLTEEEIGKLRNWYGTKQNPVNDELQNLDDMKAARGGGMQNSVGESRSASSGDSFAGGEQNLADPPPSYEDIAPKVPTVDEDLEKGVKKTLEKTGEDDAIEAGGEAATGVLDMIPGLDILGLIGGSVLAGIEAHKQKVQEKLGEAAATAGAGITMAIQAGVGGSGTN